MAEEFSITNMLQEAKEKPAKLGIPVGAIACIGALVWFKLCAPKNVQITKQLKSNKGLVGSIKSFKSAASQLEDIKLDIEEQKQKWEENKKLCYKELEQMDFMRRVRELAVKANINVKSINPIPDENIKIGIVDAKKFSVQFAYSGDLEHLLTFMRYVELEQKVCFMPIPNLKPNASGTFDMTLTISTILLPDGISTDMPEGQGEEEEEEEEE